MPRVLVVDDEPDIRFLIRHILELGGHSVTEAPNGSVALARILESPPDLVVTDVMMPIMDGAELIRRLRADPRTAHLPILAVSGNPLNAGAADAVLSKPFSPRELAAVAASLLTVGV